MVRVLHSSQSAIQCEAIVFSLLTLSHCSEFFPFNYIKLWYLRVYYFTIIAYTFCASVCHWFQVNIRIEKFFSLFTSTSPSWLPVFVVALLQLCTLCLSCTNVDLFLSWSRSSAYKEKSLLFKKLWWPYTVDLNMVYCLLFLVVLLLLGVLLSEAALDYFLFSLSTICQDSVPV